MDREVQTSVVHCLSRPELPLLRFARKGEAWSAHFGDIAALVVEFTICAALGAKVFLGLDWHDDTDRQKTDVECEPRMLVRCVVLLFAASIVQAQPRVPRTWDEREFSGWQLHLAGQGFTAGHFTESEYYQARVDNLRTYPVYAPDSEPQGYWKFLNTVGPRPLIDANELKTNDDWIEAGRRIFEELDFVPGRSYDPEKIRKIRSRSYLADRRIEPLPDGTIAYLRWVVTETGVALTTRECSGCHLRWIPGPVAGGKPYHGVPENMIFPNLGFSIYPYGAGSYVPQGDTRATIRWRGHFVPWIADDVHARMKTMPDREWEAWDDASNGMGMAARWDGSIYYPTKIPDLIGVKDRKYLDHTATHRNRGIADLMRYAAQVVSADSPHFGPFDILPRGDRRVPYRLSDDALYALALYIHSIEPPPNPNKFDSAAAAGQKLFASTCAGCHTPPLYTNNKLTLAKGFQPGDADRGIADVMNISVGTDPGEALLTRKGTGYYKVPSLKGVWYRGHFLHDGSLTTLEELFDPGRLRADFEPTGWNPPGVKKRAVVGHEFGLSFPAEQRRQLLAFLRTL